LTPVPPCGLFDDVLARLKRGGIFQVPRQRGRATIAGGTQSPPPPTGRKAPPQFWENLVTDADTQSLKTTPLDALHREHGAKMVPFARYAMPVHYDGGIIKEHLHTRAKASLFDVSHMGQARLVGDDAAAALETLVPGDIKGLGKGKTRYTLLTNDRGGIIDDVMVTNRGGHLFIVVNAACKKGDFAHIRKRIGKRAKLKVLRNRALIALQGPAAAAVIGRFMPAARHMLFMTAETFKVGDIECFVTRSGYTGEDGYEISVAAEDAENLARLLLDEPEVMLAGLGARDSLRLEAGLCLYGSDIDAETTPIEANLAWVIGKRRREEGGFPGADVILGQLRDGAPRKRVGLRPDGKAPARAHTPIEDTKGNAIGEVTSGGYGPSVEAPIAMGYVDKAFAAPETPVNLKVRGKALAGRVVKLPFVEQRYFNT
jgi:aminomethyltransferase